MKTSTGSILVNSHSIQNVEFAKKYNKWQVGNPIKGNSSTYANNINEGDIIFIRNIEGLGSDKIELLGIVIKCVIEEGDANWPVYPADGTSKYITIYFKDLEWSDFKGGANQSTIIYKDKQK